MAILNYTTSIPVQKTVMEIQEKLAKAGAQAVLTEYDSEGFISALSFRIITSSGVIMFRMPSRTEGVLRIIENEPKVPKSKKTKEQALRVAWRILKDWVEVQVALVETEQAELAEVFLPFAQNSDGMTVYESLKGGGFKQLALQ